MRPFSPESLSGLPCPVLGRQGQGAGLWMDLGAGAGTSRVCGGLAVVWAMNDCVLLTERVHLESGTCPGR